MAIKYLAFDIDGTIFSSEGIILSVYKEAIEHFKEESGLEISVPTQARLMAQIGKPVKTIFLNLLPELTEPQRDSISESVLKILCERIQNGEGLVYPGVTETLKELHERGYVLLTASNGRIPYIETILQVSKVADLFTQKVTLDYKTLHTKGDILKHYLAIYNENPEMFLMIGDRLSDYEAASDAKVPFIFCEYGHAESGEIPDFYKKVGTVSELKDILKKRTA